MMQTYKKTVTLSWAIFLKHFWLLAIFATATHSFTLLGTYLQRSAGLVEPWLRLNQLLFVILAVPFHTAFMVACLAVVGGKDPWKTPLFLFDRRTLLVLWVDVVFWSLRQGVHLSTGIPAARVFGVSEFAVYAGEWLMFLVVAAWLWWVNFVRLYPALILAASGGAKVLRKSWKLTQGRAWEVLGLIFVSMLPGLVFLLPMFYLVVTNQKQPWPSYNAVMAALQWAAGLFVGFGYLLNASYTLGLGKRRRR